MQFERFVSERLGFGKYHYILMAVTLLVEITDGMQTSAGDSQVSLMTAVFYTGIGIGTLVFGKLADVLGRRKSILIGIVIQIFSGTLLAFNFSYFWFVFFRFCYGIGFGSTVSVVILLLSQTLSLKHRGRGLLILNFAASIGRLAGSALSLIYLQNAEIPLVQNKFHHNYVASDSMNQVKKYMLACTSTCVLSFIFNCFYLKDSYRGLMLNQKYPETYELLDSIIKTNGEQNSLSQQQKQQIIQWSQNLINKNLSQSRGCSDLAQYKKIIFLLGSIWFISNFISFGETFIIPFILGTSQKGLMMNFWMTMGEIPVVVANWYLIQLSSFGRKMSICIAFFASIFLCTLTSFYISAVGLFFTKAFIKSVVQVLYPFTPQSFPTSVRAIGSGIVSAGGRIGATIMPFIIFPIYHSYPKSPFLIFAVFSILGLMVTFAVPRQTRGQPLDEQSKIENDISLEQKRSQ